MPARGKVSTPVFVEILFWLFFAVIAWTYLGYPALVALQARLRPVRLQTTSSDPLPRIAVIIAARNEADSLRERLLNLLSQQYAAEKLRIVVVCNGCTDDSVDVATNIAGTSETITVVESSGTAGKAAAVNEGVTFADSAEILVFADSRQTFAPDAIRRLVLPFVDPAVGAVTGRLIVQPAGDSAVEGIRRYWGFETWLRSRESRSGSVIGVTGAMYAIRRSLYPEIRPGLILDDVFVPMAIAMRGHRVVMAEDAIAYDVAASNSDREFWRKRRTTVGNLQLLLEMPGLLSPFRNPLFLRYLSHKVLRIATPLCLLGILFTSAQIGGAFYGGVFVVLAGLYAVGILALSFGSQGLPAVSAFVLMHAAVFSALLRWRQDASQIWTTQPESPSARPAQPVHGSA